VFHVEHVPGRRIAAWIHVKRVLNRVSVFHVEHVPGRRIAAWIHVKRVLDRVVARVPRGTRAGSPHRCVDSREGGSTAGVARVPRGTRRVAVPLRGFT